MTENNREVIELDEFMIGRMLIIAIFKQNSGYLRLWVDIEGRKKNRIALYLKFKKAKTNASSGSLV